MKPTKEENHVPKNRYIEIEEKITRDINIGIDYSNGEKVWNGIHNFIKLKLTECQKQKEEEIKKSILWFDGWNEGIKSVFEFLTEMKGFDKSWKVEYDSWESADEYTKQNGEVVKRYE